ncbi:MAG: transposase [Gemmatimonadales bacterium]
MSDHAHRLHRRSIRLQAWDYAEIGAYFVTLNAHRRAHLFGKVARGRVVLSVYGAVARDEWLRTARLRPEIELDAFVVMPDHMHGIIRITTRRTSRCPRAGNLHREPETLGSILAGYKAACTSRINVLRGTPGGVVWQRNYYEHIIRTSGALARIRRYIETNPARWPAWGARSAPPPA